MKRSYKMLFLMVCSIGFAVFLMSSEYQTTAPGGDLAELEPTAYKNLITYQEGDLSVFQTTSPSTSKVSRFKASTTKALGNRLALPKSTGKITKYSTSDPTAFYEQDLNKGKLSFNKGMKTYLDKGGRSLPSQKQANSISLKFLNESGLAPANKEELKMMHSGGLRAAEAGSTKVIDVMRTVTYGRMLNGVPVYGAGSKIVVQVGNQGEIVGATSRWKEVSQNSKRTAKKSEMKSAREAEVEMKRRLLTDFGKGTKAEIKNMSLAYYDGGKTYIQPAFFFQIEMNIPQVKDAPAVKFDYMGIVPALKNAPEAIEVMQTPPAAKSKIEKLSVEPPRNVRKKDPRNID